MDFVFSFPRLSFTKQSLPSLLPSFVSIYRLFLPYRIQRTFNSSCVFATFSLPPCSKATYHCNYLLFIIFKMYIVFLYPKEVCDHNHRNFFLLEKSSFLGFFLFVFLVLINSTSDFVED